MQRERIMDILDAGATHLPLRSSRFFFLGAGILGLALWLAACGGVSRP
jgi:hypothetical protein